MPRSPVYVRDSLPIHGSNADCRARYCFICEEVIDSPHEVDTYFCTGRCVRQAREAYLIYSNAPAVGRLTAAATAIQELLGRRRRFDVHAMRRAAELWNIRLQDVELAELIELLVHAGILSGGYGLYDLCEPAADDDGPSA